jgi:cytochrome c oxidase cbb3-type subunit III
MISFESANKMRPMRTLGMVALILVAWPEFARQSSAQSPAGRGAPAPGQSPASQRPPATAVPQSYSAGQIQAGESRFVSECGFCHGRDAQGGESGPDLTRSSLVAEDVRGDKIGPVILSGRADKGMPAFRLPAADVAAIVAFIHDEKSKAESAAGGRRSVDLSDLETGNVEAGKRYFSGDGGCIKCHTLSGSFATVGTRFQGLALLQRMLNPSRGPRTGSFLPAVTITLASGQKVTGKLAYRDEFTVTLIDSDGWTHSWPAAEVKVESDDPLQAHFEPLGRYTDEEIHDLFAFLQTLR